MTKRTYKPEDYSPETRAAMKNILALGLFAPGAVFDSDQWVSSDIPDIADIIEKAIVSAKQVTEEKVRAACAAVAEANLSNKKGDPK